ncbi:MAG: hypothetical protein JWQ15_950 [Marmoricola sp.]|nr:hypothetical protein [Marmoricola sp.]
MGPVPTTPSGLHDYFPWATTTTTMSGITDRPTDDVPGGLPIPHWSWDVCSPELRSSRGSGHVKLRCEGRVAGALSGQPGAAMLVEW